MTPQVKAACDRGAARCQVAIVADAVDRIVRYVTLGDVVPLSSERGAAGEWALVEDMLRRSLL